MNIEVEIQDFLEKFVELVLKAGLSISLSILVSKMPESKKYFLFILDSNQRLEIY